MRPLLLSASPDASAEELAAMVAALELVDRERRAAHSVAADGDVISGRLDGWVTVSRSVARRSGMSRGLWRISGRVARHSRG